MSYPILYKSTTTNFNNNGIGILSACVSCEVTEEANGAFELAMQYPMDGVHFAEIGDRAIVKAKADQFRDPQLFRVYAISKPMNGIVTVLAEHISYDLSGIPVKTFSASSASSALAGLKNNAVVDCPFEFWTDKATSARFSVPTPASIRSRLGGAAGSILDVYGGEYEFDNYTVKLHNNRGMNRGVSIRYGKNLTDIKQEQNCASVATGVYPYWAGTVDEKDVLVELPERIVNAHGTYNFVKIRTVDFTQNFETRPTVEQLRSATENYIKNNNIGVPSVSLTVSFAQLEQTEEYKHLKLLERVSLFDTVNVEFPALGVSATAKAVKMVYDVIADRVKSVTLGSVRANIADTIATQQKEIDYSKDKPTLSMVQKISSALAKAIMGADGGAVRLIDTNDDGEPDELYIADNADPTKALKVWRFNYNGWAASKNGYSGPFEFGATLEEGLLANFVTAAHLVAGTIKSADSGETFFLDLDNGILNMNATSLNISGKTVDDIAQGKVNAQTQEDIFNKLTNNGALQGLYMKDGKLYINATYIKSGKIVSEGMAYLPPTYDDCIDMLRSLTFPDKYPPKNFYDINGDGKFDVEDVRLANRVYLGEVRMSDCAGATATAVTVTIDPFNAEKTIVLVGTNIWGKQIDMSLGVVRSMIPHIYGDCSVSGRLSVGGHFVAGSFATSIGETPKTLSWKSNGDGTFTLIGK